MSRTFFDGSRVYLQLISWVSYGPMTGRISVLKGQGEGEKASLKMEHAPSYEIHMKCVVSK